jgi:hypothetical protein
MWQLHYLQAFQFALFHYCSLNLNVGLIEESDGATSAMNFIPTTRGGVDASPEHPCPRFDGGTRVRTVPTISS